MVNETLQAVQAKLNELALTLPELQNRKQWAEIINDLAGLSHYAQRQELLLETVAAISDTASSILDVNDLLQVAVNLIQDYFDLYYVAIYLVEESNDYIRLRAGSGKAGQLLLQKELPRKVGEESMIGWCVQHRQSLIALDEEEFQNPYLPDAHSEMTLPLINRGQVIGALDLQSSQSGAFSQEDIALFQTLADQLANTIQNTQLFTENDRLLKQAENSRRFLKTVIEHIPDPIFIKDQNHTLLEMNQANAQVIGQPQPKLIGKTDRDFFPPELAEQFYRRDDIVFTNSQIFEAEDKTIWGDGQEHIAYTRLIPIPNAAGQAEYLLGITQDVTGIRARETERERMLAETAALYQGSRAVASAWSERQIFEAIFEQIRLADPCEVSAFRFNVVDNESIWAELKVNWQKRNTPSYAVGTRFYLPEFTQSKLLTSNVPLFIDNIAADERLSANERASFEPTGACSVAILPLAAANQQLGAILVYFTRPQIFTEEMQRLWLAMTDQVYIALVNRQLIEEAAYRAIRMETAAEVARAASSILEVQDLLEATVALICDRFELYYVGAFLVDEVKEWAVLKAGTGEAGRIQLQKGHRLKIGGESMIGWSVDHRQPRIALDVGKEAVRFQNPDLPKTRSEIALPLIYHNEAIGALTVQSEEPAAFNREDILFLQTMADQLANAVKTAQLYEKARQEIGERTRIEEALRASEALYQSLVDNIPQNILRKDREGKFVFGNKSFCEILGVSLEELIGKTDFDFYPAELAEKYRRDDERVISTRSLFETVEENQLPNGEKKYVRVIKSSIIDFSGEIIGTQGIFWDITERKKAEDALRESQQRLDLALHGADLGLWDYNVQTGANIVDERAAAMLGYLLDEVEPCVEWWDSRTHPDDLSQVQIIWDEHLAGKTPFYETEYRLRTKLGDWIWILDRGAIVKRDDMGRPLRVAGTHLDITQRKRAETLLTGQQRVFEMIAKGASLPATLNVLAEFIERLSNQAFYVSIMLMDTNRTNLRSVAAPSLPSTFVQAIDGLPIGPKVGSCGTAAYRGEQVISSDIATDPLWVDYADWIISTYGLRACWSTPVLAMDGKVLGTFAMYHTEPHTPATVDLELIQTAVQLAEIAIERRQAEEALQQSLARTQLLYNISEALATLINRRAAFETVLGEFLLLLKLSQGKIMLLDPAGENNITEALYIDNRVIEPDRVLPTHDDLITQHLRKNPFPLVIEDVSTHPLTHQDQVQQDQVEAMLLIPIVTRGEVVGIVGADAAEKGHIFTPDDIEVGKVLADQLSIWLDNHQLLTEAQYRSERLQTAAEVSRAASSILDINELINTSVNMIRDQFDFYYVGLFLVDGAKEWAVLRAGTGEAGQIQLHNKHKLRIGGESMIGWCIQNRKARIALDVGQEAVRFQNPYLPDTHSEMALPLISRDEVIGAITVQSTEQSAFSDEDITLLQTMADQLANAIQNARLFTSVTRAQLEAEALLKDTQALQQFSQMLAGTLQVQEIMNIFFEACEMVLRFEYAQFCLVDKYQHRVKAVAGFGIAESQIRRANHSLDGQDIMADIIRTGQTEIITGWDDRFDRGIFEAEHHEDWVRIFTPVRLRQENIGLVEAGFNKSTDKTIEEAQIRLLRAFIDQTALALDNAQRYEASQKAAWREALIKEITTRVRASTNVDTILQTTVKELGDALGSQRAYVHLVSPSNGDTH